MPQPHAAPPDNQIPLVVDLDGTLIKTDLLWESLARQLRRNPFALFAILFWWTRGRAFLKLQLARRVKIDPVTLPYNTKFLAWLREQKSAGRKIILATASDFGMAKPVADYVGVFDEVLASDGKINLRGANKLKALAQKFGERGFDYAGNSAADLAVWRAAREAIVVNASRSVAKRAAACAKTGASFPDYSPFETLRSVLNELLIRSGYLTAIAAGLLLSAAFPKIGVAGFAWIAPALIIFAASGKSAADAFRVGCIAGVAHFLSSLYWLLLMPAAGYPILGWLSLSAYLALFFGVWTWLASGFKFGISSSWSGRLFWALGGAACWVALEMLRGWLLGGFPWNFIGASQSRMVPLIQIASVTGVYGVSFLVVWASLSLYSAAQMIFQKPALRFIWQAEIILPFAVVVGVFIFGMTQLREHNSAPTLRVTLVQPGFPQTLIWDENQNTSRFRELLALSENALDESEGHVSDGRVTRVPDTNTETNSVTQLTRSSELLIWPESAVPEFNDSTYAAITNLAHSRGVWLIFNADDVVPRPNATNEFDNDVFNAAFLFAPDGGWAGIYHKQKLVIFGEYIPLVRWLPFVKWFTPITGGFEAGNEAVQFKMDVGVQASAWPTNTVKRELQRVVASPLICFEDTFPQLARKAASTNTDFLVNLTNDGWFGESAEQWQHEQGAIFRAVENGIPLVRCANNGITCWIDANGRVREVFQDKTKSVYGAGAMTIELPLLSRAPTFYKRHGDWFGWSCIVVAFGLLLARMNFLARKEVAA